MHRMDVIEIDKALIRINEWKVAINLESIVRVRTNLFLYRDYSRNSRRARRESAIRVGDDTRADGSEQIRGGSKIRGSSAQGELGGMQARGTLGFLDGKERHTEQLGSCDGAAVEVQPPHFGRIRTRAPLFLLHEIPDALPAGGQCCVMRRHDREPRAALGTELP